MTREEKERLLEEIFNNQKKSIKSEDFTHWKSFAYGVMSSIISQSDMNEKDFRCMVDLLSKEYL
jgi:hypothetical protein